MANRIKNHGWILEEGSSRIMFFITQKNVLRLCIFVSLFFSFTCNSVFAQIGILNSNSSAKIYSSKHIGNYSDLFQEVIYTFNNTNIKYNVISENDINSISTDNFNIIMIPLVMDLSQETYLKLEQFVKDGGKLIVTFPDAYTSPTIQKLADLVGVQLDQPKRNLYKTYVNMTQGGKLSENDFPASTKFAYIKPYPATKSIAVWNQIDETIPAVAISNNGGYIGWKWGNDGNLAFNVNVIKATMEAVVSGIIKKEQAKIAFKDFESKVSEIAKLRQDATEFIDLSTQLDSSVKLADVQEHIYISKMHENLAKSYYQNSDYEKSQGELKKSKLNAIYAYAKTTPSPIVEARTLWLDRGTIVTIKNPEEMSALFDKVQKIGINLVYFETINAGYAIYPSKITSQNPLTSGWDPLYWAIQEAHKRNIELHAWTWVFAVGNIKHNPIIGKSNDYPGPILAKYPELALTGADGNMLPLNQYEYWIDPSNYKARQLILSILEEIVSNYQVDGIQLDYIRYPFQTNGSLMGFNSEGKQKFEIESGYKLDNVNLTVIQAWNNWKIKQVSRFVQEASSKLRKIKPDIKISAAVFGNAKSTRISQIQQDWETWVDKGWIDILNPMIYSPTTTKLVENLNYITKNTNNKAFVYPGIAVRQLEADDLLEQIYAIKDYGLMGSTIFAMAHLGPEKSELLSVGPYKYKQAQVPNKDPMNSARVLVEEFLFKANNIKTATTGEVFYKYAGNAVIAEAGKAHTYILSITDNPTPEKIEKAIGMLQNLEDLTQRWLLVDSSIKPLKIKILTDYLKEAEILLTYEQHRQNLKDAEPPNIVNINLLSQNNKN